MWLRTVAGTATEKIRVYAINYNVLRIMSGMCWIAESTLWNIFDNEKENKKEEGRKKKDNYLN